MGRASGSRNKPQFFQTPISHTVCSEGGSLRLQSIWREIKNEVQSMRPHCYTSLYLLRLRVRLLNRTKILHFPGKCLIIILVCIADMSVLCGSHLTIFAIGSGNSLWRYTVCVLEFSRLFYHINFHTTSRNMTILDNSPQGGENRTKTDVRLACKAVSVRFSTSGGRPMLLGPDAFRGQEDALRALNGAGRFPANHNPILQI